MTIRFLFICFFTLGFSNHLFAQAGQPCKVTENLGGKYKFVSGDTSIVEGRKIFFLTIKLKPNKFNKEYLMQVAQRIRETYCKEGKINTVILDSSDNRKFDDLTPPPIFPPAAKALYSLDKIENRELIQFISSSKVTDEIKLRN